MVPARLGACADCRQERGDDKRDEGKGNPRQGNPGLRDFCGPRKGQEGGTGHAFPQDHPL